MIGCVVSLTVLLLADAALTLWATSLPGLSAVVLFWIIAYSALVYVWPSVRNGLRWFVIILGILTGFTLDFVVLQQPFQWFAAVMLVVAAGHFAGWTEAMQLLLARGSRSSRPPPRHGRPATFSVAFGASFVLAYLCQSPASGLTTRPGLFASFAAVALGFLSWELGRSNRSRRAPLKKKPPTPSRLLRWASAGVFGLLAFFAFAQVLPLAATRVSNPTPVELSREDVEIPDVPNLAGSDPDDSDNQGLSSLPGEEHTVDQLPSGLSQGGVGREAEHLPGEPIATGSRGEAGSQGPVTVGSQRDTELVEEDQWREIEDEQPAETAITSPINPGDSFWELPPGMIWPFLALVLIATVVGLLVLWFTQTSTVASEDDETAQAARRPSWEHDTVPGYLREFLARAAKLGYERERGHTLREFLRLLRRAKVTRNEFNDLSTYHYDVQFENKTRDPATEREFRRKAKELLQ